MHIEQMLNIDGAALDSENFDPKCLAASFPDLVLFSNGEQQGGAIGNGDDIETNSGRKSDSEKKASGQDVVVKGKKSLNTEAPSTPTPLSLVDVAVMKLGAEVVSGEGEEETKDNNADNKLCSGINGQEQPNQQENIKKKSDNERGADMAIRNTIQAKDASVESSSPARSSRAVSHEDRETIDRIRQENLIKITSLARGIKKRIADAMNVHPSIITRRLQSGGIKDFEAREIEKVCGLKSGMLDRPLEIGERSVFAKAILNKNDKSVEIPVGKSKADTASMVVSGGTDEVVSALDNQASGYKAPSDNMKSGTSRKGAEHMTDDSASGVEMTITMKVNDGIITIQTHGEDMDKMSRVLHDLLGVMKKAS
jgi:hypothetical protein